MHRNTAFYLEWWEKGLSPNQIFVKSSKIMGERMNNDKEIGEISLTITTYTKTYCISYSDKVKSLRAGFHFCKKDCVRSNC